MRMILGEDETFNDNAKKVAKREIDHKFTREEVWQELRDILGFYFLASTID